MSEKKELVEKARRLGKEYMRKYGGCAPASLLAVADTLNLEVGDDLYKAMTGFSSFAGACGNICGGIAAIGLMYGMGREDFEKDPQKGFSSWRLCPREHHPYGYVSNRRRQTVRGRQASPFELP